MPQKEPTNDTTRYLKKFQIVMTKTELPIQGQVQDPEDLFVFLKDLQDSQVPKIVCIYLDTNNLFLGHQVFLGVTPTTFDTQLLYHYYALFLAKRFMLLINHPSGDATPLDEDIALMKKLQVDEQALSFKPFFADLIVVGDKSYFSMATNDGSNCRCGHQKYMDL